MWHRPVLTIGPHNVDEGNMRAFRRKLYDYNADVVLNGHDHDYARYAPLNRDANAPMRPEVFAKSSPVQAVRV